MRKTTKAAKKRIRLMFQNKKRPNVVTLKARARRCEYLFPVNYLLEEHPEL